MRFVGPLRLLEPLLRSFRDCLDRFPDKRSGMNTTYCMGNIGMSPFSVFFMQSPSFLAHQRQFEEGHGRSNCANLFGIVKIPSDNHIRDMLNPASPALLHPVCAETVEQLRRIDGGLDVFRRLGERVLIALDGTEYHCSRNIHCSYCSARVRGKSGREYYHSMLAATLVAPGHDKVIPLEPEFIAPRDAAEKKDCENMAAKRSAGHPRPALRGTRSGLSRRRSVLPPAALPSGPGCRRALPVCLQAVLTSADPGISDRRRPAGARTGAQAWQAALRPSLSLAARRAPARRSRCAGGRLAGDRERDLKRAVEQGLPP